MPYLCKSHIAASGGTSSRDKRLTVCLREDGFSFAETTPDGRLQSFGEAEGRHASTMTGTLADVKQFLGGVGIKPLGYARMQLVVMSRHSTWVPDELYSSASNRSYLRLAGVQPDGVAVCHSERLASTAVFSANEQTVTAFKVAMPGVSVMNQHALLAGLAPLFAGCAAIVSHWRDGLVDVAAFHDGRYLVGNTFACGTAEEAVYRLVDVMKSYSLEQAGARLLLCGKVDQQVYEACCPYFPEVDLFAGTGTPEQDAAFDGFPFYEHALLLI
ncbi:MAG: DUF3822 family protein [Bacteroidales bacterium]|nr:DUF3822 family protein [Bacteroidales bacterium]